VIETALVDVQQVQRHVGHGLGDVALGAHLGVVTHAAQQAVGDARRTTGTAGDFKRAFRIQRQAENAAERLTMVARSAVL
jgi:hypothetical protein